MTPTKLTVFGAVLLMVWVVLFALTPSDSMLRWVQLSGFVVTLGIFLFNLRLVGR